MVVALIGMDGSGKTSVVKRLIKSLHSLGIGSVYYHGFHNPILSTITKISKVSNFTLNGSKARSEKDVRTKLLSAVVTLWHVIMFFETLLFFLYVKLFKTHKKIIIFDRFWLDRYIYLIVRDRANIITHLLYQVVYPLFINPDLLVCLTVDPNIAYQRKRVEHPNYTEQFYEKLKDTYNYIVKCYTKVDKVVIDTTKRDPNEVSDIILKKIILKELDKVLPIVKANRTECRFLSLVRSFNLFLPQIEKLGKEVNIRRMEYMASLSILSELNRNFNKFLIYKSHNSAIERIPRDLDILVEKPQQIRNFVSLFTSKLNEDYRKSTKLQVQWDKPWEVRIMLPHYKIEVCSDISWFNHVFVPNQIIFNNTKSFTFNSNYRVRIPTESIDFLLRCVHAVFGDFSLRYDEYKHLNNLLSNMKKENLMFMRSVAQRMGWEDAYLYFITLLESINRKSAEIERIKHGFESPTFPVYIPYCLVIGFVVKMLIRSMKSKKLNFRRMCIVLGYFLIHFAKNSFYRVVNALLYTKTYRYPGDEDENK